MFNSKQIRHILCTSTQATRQAGPVRNPGTHRLYTTIHRHTPRLAHTPTDKHVDRLMKAKTWSSNFKAIIYRLLQKW